MKKSKIFILVLLLIAGIAAGWYWIENEHQNGSLLTLYGNIDIRQVELSFDDSEHVKNIYVQEGDLVETGQLLAEQDLERFRYAVDNAEAKLEVQQQIVNRLLNGSRPEEIAKANADVKAAKATLVFTRKELVRMQRLAAQKLISKEAVDRARAERDSAQETLKALSELLSLAEIGPRREDILAAEAQLKADTAALKAAKKSWQDAHLYSPSPGIIQNRILEPGDMADSQHPVLTLALIDPVWVRTYVSEPNLGKLSPGMIAWINNDSYPDARYRGWVGYISPTAEFTPKSVETTELRTSLVYQLRVYVCNPQNQLRLGMPVTVTIDLNQPEPDLQRSCPTAQPTS